MKLIKLSSTNPNFKTIEFKDGLNIVAGLQISDSERATYNGVGKSFSLNLIHVLLGGSFKTKNQSEKKILEFLKGYGTFELEFSINTNTHKISKNFKNSFWFIDNTKVNTTNIKSELTKLILRNKAPSNISAKNILNVFARRYGQTYYSDALTQQGQNSSDFHQQYVNLWLLGINTDLVIEKKHIKERITKLKDLKKEIEKFEYEVENSNVKDLKDELEVTIKKRAAFVIAENYDEFEQEADRLTREINDIRSERQKIVSLLNTKSMALKQATSLDIDLDKVTQVYNEAEFFFSEKVTGRLNDAKHFHSRLVEGRVARFNSEIVELDSNLKSLEKRLILLEKSRDEILKDLSSKGALDEYNSINERIKTIEKQIGELQKYTELLNSIKADEIQLDSDNAELMSRSAKYLVKEISKLDTIENTFREIVKRFYDTSGGHFKVKLAKDAKYLFDIDIHVPKDQSQGVNEVKIFCYDFLLFDLNPSLIEFIAHDGCIFSEMDPRQKSKIFKVALDYVNNKGLQYFVNIGQSSLEEVLDKDKKINILTESEKLQIENSLRLELFDKDPSNWLFGESFG